MGADTFWMSERAEENGALRLRLAGELDIATAGQLRERIQTLVATGYPVVLDLGWLEFMDSTGVRELIRAVCRTRREGGGLTLDGTVRPQVLRVIDLLGLRELLWPPS